VDGYVMAWELEIHHIDVVTAGDATLIVARDVQDGVTSSVRTALIDGGDAGAARIVYPYLQEKLRRAPSASSTGGSASPGYWPVDVMIATHYDRDHSNGLTKLLLMPPPPGQPGLFDGVRIYDQGWPQTLDNTYLCYICAINGQRASGRQVLTGLHRERVTLLVRAAGAAPNYTLGARRLGPPAAPQDVADVQADPGWLLNAYPHDLLWDGFPGGPPLSAPTMQCVAANTYVRTANGIQPVGGQGADPSNERSLAFVVTFGQFRYYIGGDIETPQETLIQAYLNPAANAAGRVAAFKTSHHGANTATARGFVDQLRPDAAVISCGTRNRYRPNPHPAQETVNVLDGFPANPTGVNPAPRHPAVPPAIPPSRPVRNYLTGYQTTAPPPPASRGGDASVTAGGPNANPPEPGHIVVTVSADQSAADPRGRLYLGVLAAAQEAATTAGMTPQLAGPAAAAAEAALSRTPSSAGQAFLQAAGCPNVALPALTSPSTAGPATTLTHAAMQTGIPEWAAAGAGAAVGAAYWGGDLEAGDPVYDALVAAGVEDDTARSAAGRAANNVPDGPGLFDVTCYELALEPGPRPGWSSSFSHV
jgi:hypothetical protein